jgi:S1-C subfamily serine protease
MQNVSVGFAEDASNGFFTSGVLDGIIGTEILRRFDLIFDYPAGRLALKPTDALEDDFRFGKSGLKLRVEPGSITVIDVVPGSPAEEAMIEPGSALVTVDGQSTNMIGMDGLREIFTRPDGTEIEVMTSKNGQPRTSVLKLRTYY